MRPKTESRLLVFLSSLELTMFCMALLMVLVVICTLAQVPLGIHVSVERFIRSFLVWWTPSGAPFKIPVFPGGGLVGLVLLVNLFFAQFMRLERSRRKAGLWIAHLGLALLFAGEFATAFFQNESMMAIEEGQTRDWSENDRRLELAVVDATDPAFDDARLIPDSRLKRGGTISHESLPFTLKVLSWHDNAVLSMAGPGDAPSGATAGIGAGLSVRPRPPVTTDDERNAAAALVKAEAGGKDLGTFLLSNALGAPQGFVHEGRTWRLALRSRRYYLPFSLTLKKFSHDRYPGTDIPKNFSSLVRLKDPTTGDDRDALIYMNAPLRHGGRTFYQASFGKNDTLSVLQVVRNPGWTLPYLSCILVSLGMLIHFGANLRSSLKAAK